MATTDDVHTLLKAVNEVTLKRMEDKTDAINSVTLKRQWLALAARRRASPIPGRDWRTLHGRRHAAGASPVFASFVWNA